jgi:hypothetical protein
MYVAQYSSLQYSSLTTGSSEIQGVGGHHRHHHMSMSDRVDKMESAIADALKAGTLTSDQASAMKKELDDVKSKLGIDQSGQTGSMAQLSEDDRKKVRDEMHDVAQQLFAALNSQDSTQAAPSTSSTNQLSNLFAKIDANGDGKIDKSEFTNFSNNLASSAGGAGDTGGLGLYGRQGSFSMTTTVYQSQINIVA